MVPSKLLFSGAVALLAIAVATCGRLSTNSKPPAPSPGKPEIRHFARAVDSEPSLLMADIPRKSDADGRSKKAGSKPPGLSDLRKTYKLPRIEIHESLIGVTQPIDDHWCENFHLAKVPFACSCWRYEYLAYFCVDWFCTNGHSSDFAMCQFLNVSWPIDPPKKRVSTKPSFWGGLNNLLNQLTSIFP